MTSQLNYLLLGGGPTLGVSGLGFEVSGLRFRVSLTGNPKVDGDPHLCFKLREEISSTDSGLGLRVQRHFKRSGVVP